MNFELVTLPRLHAKVYIFDGKYAVVGSSNLTPSGLEFNYEYNVGLSDKRCVRNIVSDMSDYSTLGSKIKKEKLDELPVVVTDLMREHQKAVNSTSQETKRKFKEIVKGADIKFIEAFVGSKSAYSIFKEMVIYCLMKESLSTKDLHVKVQQMLPEFCTNGELVINGQRFGKRWKHQIRTVLNDLRRKDEIAAENKTWRLRTNLRFIDDP